MRFITTILLIVGWWQNGPAQETSKPPTFYDWFKVPSFEKPGSNPSAKKLPLIRVQGSRFVNALGDTILFRGCAIADPDKLDQQGHWKRDHFVKVREMGASIVRIPVHPVPWRMRTPANYLRLLDQAVDWCTELGMYVVIDWHSIGNLGMELFQDPVYNTTRRETYEFWRTIAEHFKGNNTVAFYELFNEPTLFNGRFGRMSWSEWKKIIEDIITLIRAYDNETIPLVAGLDWAYDLTPLLVEPIQAEGIGYVTHPYPHKRGKPYEVKWDENFGFAANRYPVFATEFGFSLGKEGMAENGEYGKAIIDYLEGKGMSWIAWVFDPDWYPRMFASWDTYALTESGEFFKQAMQQRIDRGRK
jgi:endoglucanase